MVEGGATVIQSFLDGASCDPKSSYIDSVIVTVAPTFVGTGGVGYDANITDHTVGLDVVVKLHADTGTTRYLRSNI